MSFFVAPGLQVDVAATKKKIPFFFTLVIIVKWVSNQLIIYLDCRKLSAKGSSKTAQKMLTHQRYRDTLTSGSSFITENSRIASESHNLLPVTSTKTSLSALDDKRYILDDGQQTLPYGHKNIVGQTVSGIEDSDDNAAAVNFDPTDNDDLEKWMPSFEYRQRPVSWDCDGFLDGVSDEFANTQNVDWDHPEIDDEYSEDSFALENTQSHRSLRQLMDQVISSWQTPDTGLIRAAETNDSDIDSGDIADLKANTSDEDESSFFNDSYSDSEAVEVEKQWSKNRRID